MTLKFNNVYVENTATVAGKLEAEGPYGNFFDKTYEDYYIGESSFELAEVKLQKDSIDTLLLKTKTKKEQIDLHIGGDLLNQIAPSYYAASEYKIPYLGLYSACTNSTESIILGSLFIDTNKANKVITTTSSHNLAAEKQFRNPIEYEAPKPKTATFTATGGCSILLTSQKDKIKVTAGTIGKIIDLEQTNVNHMGAIMAPAAADTIARHLKNLNDSPKNYDLILTGDLGIYGAKILKDYIKQEYKLDLGDNYNDCGAMLYDLENQKQITGGGSGCACSALVTYSYVMKMLKEKKYKKVMLVATGALFSPTFAFQKQHLLGIAHAVTFEGVDK